MIYRGFYFFRFISCSLAAAPAPRPIGVRSTGSSKTLTVRGEYSAVAIDQIDGMALRDGKLALRGSQTTIAVDLPPTADADRNLAAAGRSSPKATATATGP